MADNHSVRRIARGTNTVVSRYAGPAGELVMNTGDNSVHLQNGSAGGIKLANDSTVVHNTGNEVISGTKTFVTNPVVSSGGVSSPLATTAYVNNAVSSGGTSYTLPTATASRLGGVIVSGGNLTVNANGLLSVSGTVSSATHATSATSAGYATSAGTVTGTVSSATSAGYATSAGTVTGTVTSASNAAVAAKIGTSTVGGVATPVYINGGTPTAINITSAASSILANAPNSGVTSGTYGPTANATLSNTATFTVPSYTVNAKGLITSAANHTMTMNIAASDLTIYVNASTGNDSRDGSTSALAVKTIDRAVEIAGNAGAQATIYLAGGTYTAPSKTYHLYDDDAFVVARSLLNFVLQGAVTISGPLQFSNTAVTIDVVTYKLTIGTNASALEILNFNAGCIVSIFSSASSSYGSVSCGNFSVNNNSRVTLTGNVIVNCTAFTVYRSGFVSLYSTATVNCSGEAHLWYFSQVTNGGTFNCTSDHILVEHHGCFSATNLSHTTCVGLSIQRNSLVYTAGDAYITSTGSETGLFVGTNSLFFGDAGIELTLSGSEKCMSAQWNGQIYLVSSTGTHITFSGTVSTATVEAARHSMIYIGPNCVVAGTVTGKRYALSLGGSLFLGSVSSPTTRIPGSAAGTPATSGTLVNYYGA